MPDNNITFVFIESVDYHQIALILALVGFVCTVIVLLLFFGLFLCKNRRYGIHCMWYLFISGYIIIIYLVYS